MPNSQPGTYNELAPVRALALGAADAVNPVAGALLACVDALISRRAGSHEDSTARAITQALRAGVGLRIYENMHTLAESVTGAEGYLPPELVQSEPFMRSFAVCAELSARAGDGRKLRYLFNLLMRGVVDQGALDLGRDYEFYARIVAELSMVELHMLVRLEEAERAAGPQIEDINQPYWGDFIGTLATELSIPVAEVNFRLAAIGRVSVYTTAQRGASFGDASESGEKGRLTPIGRKFLDCVRESGWRGGR